jgi:hypothetical protein
LPRHPEPAGVAGPVLALVARGQRAVRGRHTSAGVAVVHDVVVDQGRRLEELHGGGDAHDGVAVGLAGRPVAPVEERRPQPLAAREKAGDHRQQVLRVGADLGEHPGLVGQQVVDTPLHAGTQVGGVQRVVVVGVDHGTSCAARRTVSISAVPEPTACPLD